jgi:hypothetical protein
VHWCHPQEELIKFDYRSEREEKIKKKEICCILATCWNLLSKYGNFTKFLFLKIWPLWVQFFHRNLSYESHLKTCQRKKRKVELLPEM